MNHQELRLAILHRVISELDDVGKTQMQKLGYFLQEALGVPTKYHFRMHHYGPYSDGLDTDMTRLRLTGYIDIQHDPQGYGFHITSTDDNLPEEWEGLIEDYDELIDYVIRAFGNRKPAELELAATIHFVNNLAPSASKEEILKTVKALKPKFLEPYIQSHYSRLEKAGLLE
ncbi:MAG: hypothetical protein OXD31_18910 [Chloroflexi bacterium]|nr:hypothetical protein [Chloroflexota bacterium]